MTQLELIHIQTRRLKFVFQLQRKINRQPVDLHYKHKLLCSTMHDKTEDKTSKFDSLTYSKLLKEFKLKHTQQRRRRFTSKYHAYSDSNVHINFICPRGIFNIILKFRGINFSHNKALILKEQFGIGSSYATFVASS